MEVSVRIVSDNVRVFEGQTTVKNVIWDGIHDKHLYLSEQAPICKGRMSESFGYLAATIAARHVLKGTYTYPKGFDEDTKEVCRVCAKNWLEVPA
jgi:hypothetical protein